MKHARWTRLVIGIALAAGVGACGKPKDDPEPQFDGLTRVTSSPNLFSTSCPDGSVVDPKPAELGLWDCPIGVPEISLSTGPQPITLEADCEKMNLKVVSGPRQYTFWNLPVDATINLGKLPGGWVELPRDVQSATPCVSFLSLDILGKLKECIPGKKNDKVRFEVEAAIWWLGKGKKLPNVSGLRECQLPDQCSLRAQTELQQCPAL